MTLQELLQHLDEQVHFKDDHLGLDGTYQYKSCIIRKNARGLYAIAEVQNQENSVLIVPIDRLEFMNQTEPVGKEVSW